MTAPLEGQFGKIPALQVMTSSSSFGISQVTLQFDLSRDIDAAAQDVQSAISAAGSTLPRNLPYPPLYSKVNPADAPVVTLAITSKTIDQRALSDLADTVMAPRLSEVSGVGHVSVQGGIRPAIRIQADLSRLAAYGIALEDLRTAIVGANVAGAKGALDGAHQSYTIAANDQIASAAAYKAITVAFRNNAPVLLSDVADVVDGLENNKVGAWYKGQPAIVIDVQRQPGANVIDTVTRLNAELPRLKRALPAGAQLTVVTDRTDTIRASIHDVQFTLVLSIALVVLVVFVFLRTIRATIIAGVALPLSLIATFGVMWFAGFSLDNLSLMALTIGTGFVVDDAIVMIENIVRHIENGESAAGSGAQGRQRNRLYGHIADAVADRGVHPAAVHDRPGRPHVPRIRADTDHRGGRLGHRVIDADADDVRPPAAQAQRRRRQCADAAFFRLPPTAPSNSIAAACEWVLRRQFATLMVTLVTLAATIALYIIIPKGFLPLQDTGQITAVTEAGTDVSFIEMQRRQAQVEAIVRADPAVSARRLGDWRQPDQPDAECRAARRSA